MNVLEKILEEIKEAFDENIDDIEDSAGIHHFAIDSFTAWYIARKIIRSHMDEVPKCGECSRRKQYMQGYKDGKKDDGWIPVEERLPEEGKEVLAQFTVRVVHTNNKADEFVYIHTMYYENGAWQSFAGVPNGKVEAWQPLPEPYKEE